jgi:peptidoglycan hydrolase-like amidase
MAAAGAAFAGILQHYYPGTTVEILRSPALLLTN